MRASSITGWLSIPQETPLVTEHHAGPATPNSRLSDADSHGFGDSRQDVLCIPPGLLC